MQASGQRIDLRRDVKALALDIIVGIAMGHDIDATNSTEKNLQRHIDNLFVRLGGRSNAVIPYWRYLKLPVDHSADRSVVAIEHAVAGFVKNARQRMQQMPQLYQKPTNMLEAMIAASDNPDSEFTEGQLISNAILSVIGGEDTTANTIAWMINFLAQHPDAAAALTAEVDAALGDAALASDWEQIKHFPYLEAVHSETQRLRSVAPLIGLSSNADCVIADTFIPKDTLILAATTGEALNEAQFPDAQLFRPERWIFDHKPPRDEDPARKVFPFGGGPRLCPGRFLALTEIKVVISMLLRNFELKVEPRAAPVEQVFNFFVAPSAVPVRLVPRA